MSLTNWHLPRASASDWTTTRAFPICLSGDWTLCCYSCWPSTLSDRVQHAVRHSAPGNLVGQAFQFIKFSHSVKSNSLRPHGLKHTRLPCPSPTSRACPNSCPWSRWYHPTISSSVVPFSSCVQSFPTSGSFLMSQFFASGGHSIGLSA